MMSPIVKVAAALDIFACDCAVTVALKIADDSCKMDDERPHFMHRSKMSVSGQW